MTEQQKELEDFLDRSLTSEEQLTVDVVNYKYKMKINEVLKFMESSSETEEENIQLYEMVKSLIITSRISKI